MMDRGEKTKEQLSALADSELDAGQAQRLLDRMNQPALRSRWDRYHEIGDAIRSMDMPVSLSSDFSARLAARLAAEPALLAPRRREMLRTAGWRAALAAVAAASAGFFIVPGLLGGGDKSVDGVHSATGELPSSKRVLLAEAGGTATVVRAGRADYIRLHHTAHPSLYGVAPLVPPALLDDRDAN